MGKQGRFVREWANCAAVYRADENRPPVSSTSSTTDSTAVHEPAKKKQKLQLQKPRFERMI